MFRESKGGMIEEFHVRMRYWLFRSGRCRDFVKFQRKSYVRGIFSQR